jgi:hypothetical protein
MDETTQTTTPENAETFTASWIEYLSSPGGQVFLFIIVFSLVFLAGMYFVMREQGRETRKAFKDIEDS